MAVVFIPSTLRDLTRGASEIRIEGRTVRQLLDNLERLYPGLRAQFVEDDRLKPNLAVAIDGEISALGLLDAVDESSEVHFVAAIAGGSREWSA